MKKHDPNVNGVDLYKNTWCSVKGYGILLVLVGILISQVTNQNTRAMVKS